VVPAQPASEAPPAAAALAGRPPPPEINVPDDIGVGDHFPSLVPEHPVGKQRAE
jgi:hypothetical protein